MARAPFSGQGGAFAGKWLFARAREPPVKESRQFGGEQQQHSYLPDVLRNEPIAYGDICANSGNGNARVLPPAARVLSMIL